MNLAVAEFEIKNPLLSSIKLCKRIASKYDIFVYYKSKHFIPICNRGGSITRKL